MKHESEIFETVNRKPTRADAVNGKWVLAYDRTLRMYGVVLWEDVRDYPTRFPLWTSLRGWPKPAPLRRAK